MILINKHTKLNSHMAPMPINDITLIKQIMLIGISSAKFWLKGATALLADLSAGAKTNILWNCWISKSYFRFRRKKI